MKNLKVIKLDSDTLVFDNGVELNSNHDQDCYENHYLSFNDLTLDDFKDLEFDLSDDKFFKKIEDYGIELVPIKGHSIKVPGYGYNNGYYSTNLTLVISQNNKFVKDFDISECQDISG
jgi:hypothetical protein